MARTITPEPVEPRPFTVIGGFLGAGKTTLLNRVLAASKGIRYAVLVNDFGALAIDEALIAAHDGQTIALANGCICCSMSDGFVTAMLRLMQAPELFDHVLIEASGVSEPDRIMDFARLDPLLSPDAIVVLVDVETIDERLADPKIREVVTAQLHAADLLLLSKVDLVPPIRHGVVEARLRSLNVSAPILRATPDAPRLELILGGSSVDRPRADLDLHHRDHHQHAEGIFETQSFSATIPLDRAGFLRAAAGLSPSIIRGKGVLVFSDAPERAEIWQRVGARMTFLPGGPAPAASSMVLIGTERIDPKFTTIGLHPV